MEQTTQTTHFSDRMNYFFDAGVAFACQQCGACCTGEPGTVSVTEEEIAQIATYLGWTTAELASRALLPFRDSFTIREKPGGDCLFYAQGCTIYPVRPGQCRTFPFWVHNMRSPYAWKQVAASCPGIGRGPVHSREKILDILERSPL